MEGVRVYIIEDRVSELRARQNHLPSEEETFRGLSPERQGQNPASTVLYVPYFSIEGFVCELRARQDHLPSEARELLY